MHTSAGRLDPIFCNSSIYACLVSRLSQNLLEWSAIQGLVLVAKGRAAVLANVLQSMWLSPITVPIIPRSVWVNMLALRFYAYSTRFLLKMTSTSVNVMCSSSAERMQGLLRGSRAWPFRATLLKASLETSCKSACVVVPSLFTSLS